uniref:Ankyrin repeat domain-containing protein 13D-like n=1 Tax=Hirondellea gigas TaxID=1518452 RepID=A0A2P2I754_9CRUS
MAESLNNGFKDSDLLDTSDKTPSSDAKANTDTGEIIILNAEPETSTIFLEALNNRDATTTPNEVYSSSNSSSANDRMNSNSDSDNACFVSADGDSPVLSTRKFEKEFPLHWHVWHNDLQQLTTELAKPSVDLELRDRRGRTALLLAVTLGHLEPTRLLLLAGCSTQAETEQGWTVVQEAVSCGEPQLLSLVLQGRDAERHSSRALGIPHLLQKLAQAPDFYVEMKWEFTSWVPLVSRVCPSDTYRVFKRGSSVRIDTTLLGFHDTHWQRGSRSYVFKGHGGDGAVMYEVDHDKRVVYMEEMQNGGAENANVPSDALVSQRLTSPNVATTIDTDKICFERDKSGIWGWRADKSELINGHDCKVFSASNVEIVTKTRTEHLTAADKERTAAQRSPLHSFFAMAEEVHEETVPPPQADDAQQSGEGGSNNPCNISADEYFDEQCDLGARDIGRPREMVHKLQKFKAVLWLAENYPLRLQEQVMPIVDLMAISSTHFAKLQHFIQMQLPSGFPVKIEIPLFHVLTARITFGNIFGLDSGVEGVTSMEDGDRLACLLDQDIFDPPRDYFSIGGSEPHLGRSLALEEDDALLQFALHQSLLDSNGDSGAAAAAAGATMDVWEALQEDAANAVEPDAGTNGTGSGGGTVARRSPARSSPAGDRSALLFSAAQTAEQTYLQRAIEESLMLAQMTACDTAAAAAAAGETVSSSAATATNNAVSVSSPSTCSTVSESSSGSGGDRATTDSSVSPADSDLALALALSKQQLEEDQQRRRRREDDLLQQILQLSLTEK